MFNPRYEDIFRYIGGSSLQTSAQRSYSKDSPITGFKCSSTTDNSEASEPGQDPEEEETQEQQDAASPPQTGRVYTTTQTQKQKPQHSCQ
ncbi:unnamed protein product [Merluccius merluccius]